MQISADFVIGFEKLVFQLKALQKLILKDVNGFFVAQAVPEILHFSFLKNLSTPYYTCELFLPILKGNFVKISISLMRTLYINLFTFLLCVKLASSSNRFYYKGEITSPFKNVYLLVRHVPFIAKSAEESCDE